MCGIFSHFLTSVLFFIKLVSFWRTIFQQKRSTLAHIFHENDSYSDLVLVCDVSFTLSITYTVPSCNHKFPSGLSGQHLCWRNVPNEFGPVQMQTFARTPTFFQKLMLGTISTPRAPLTAYMKMTPTSRYVNTNTTSLKQECCDANLAESGQCTNAAFILQSLVVWSQKSRKFRTKSVEIAPDFPVYQCTYRMQSTLPTLSPLLSGIASPVGQAYFVVRVIFCVTNIESTNLVSSLSTQKLRFELTLHHRCACGLLT